MSAGCGRIDHHAPHEWFERRQLWAAPIVRECPGDVLTEGGQPCVECQEPRAVCRCDVERAEARNREWWAS